MFELITTAGFSPNPGCGLEKSSFSGLELPKS
jgi:hypothetical protein